MVKGRTETDTLRLIVLMAIGLVAIAAAQYVLAQRLSSAIADGMLVRESEVKQDFLSGILAAEHGAGGLFAQPGPSAALLSFGAHVRSLPGIVRANVYSPDGFIRHSTEANLIGVNFTVNDELTEAFEGKTSAVIETIHASGKPEHLALAQLEGQRLIESYIPVAGPDGKIVTVVEFYTKDSAIEAMESEVRTNLWLAAGASGLIFVALLLFSARRRGT